MATRRETDYVPLRQVVYRYREAPLPAVPRAKLPVRVRSKSPDLMVVVQDEGMIGAGRNRSGRDGLEMNTGVSFRRMRTSWKVRQSARRAARVGLSPRPRAPLLPKPHATRPGPSFLSPEDLTTASVWRPPHETFQQF